jgi:hypothetical protein
MKTIKITVIMILTIIFAAGNIYCEKQESMQPVNLNGFRLGMTYVTGDDEVDALRDAIKDPTAPPLLAQCGWQFEKQYPAGKSGLAAVVEIIPLLGGFNLGMVIPSLSTVIGIRTGSGYEIGAGPQISMARRGDDPKLATGFVVGAGLTRKVGNLYIPVNFVFSQGRTSGAPDSKMLFTLITGFAFK